MAESVLEEFGEVLGVQVVVELEKEKERAEEEGELVCGEGGAGRKDRVGLLREESGKREGMGRVTVRPTWKSFK